MTLKDINMSTEDHRELSLVLYNIVMISIYQHNITHATNIVSHTRNYIKKKKVRQGLIQLYPFLINNWMVIFLSYY